MGQADQLTPAASSFRCLVVCHHAVVAVQLWQFLVVETVSLDLAVDGRAMPADLRCDLAHRHFELCAKLGDGV